MRDGRVVGPTTIDADQSAAGALRAAGLRVTAPRRAILTWVSAHPHSTVEAIAVGVRDQLGTVSKQAVYDVLSACSQVGLLRRIEPAGHPTRYETRVGDNHHHIVCRSCGDTADVDCATGSAPCLQPAQQHGFRVDEAEVVFWGTCPRCADPPRTTQPTSPDAVPYDVAHRPHHVSAPEEEETQQ